MNKASKIKTAKAVMEWLSKQPGTEPEIFCDECNNVKQYCKKDLGDHNHLDCKSCVSIHFNQGCNFGNDSSSFPDSSYCDCICSCK